MVIRRVPYARLCLSVPGPSRLDREGDPQTHRGGRGHPSPAGGPLHLGRPQRGHQLPGPPPHPGPRGSGGDRRRGGRGQGLPGWGGRGGPPGDPGLAHRPLPAGGPPALQRPHHRAEALQLRGRPHGRVHPHPGPGRQRRPDPPGGLLGGGGDGRRHAQHRPLRGPAGRRPAWGHGGGHGGGPGGPHGHCRGPAPGGWANPSHRQPKGGGRTGPVLRRHRRAQL